MEGLTLDKKNYREKVRELGSKWRAMTPEEKEDYTVEAEWRQNQIDELAGKPLPTCAENAAGPHAGEQHGVYRNAAKKISARRLLLNESSLQSHPIWDIPTQIGDSASA